MFNKALSVEELNGYIHSIFMAEEMLQGITVFGEISGYKQSGPHAYFTLKGASAAISCTCFNFARTYVPKDGESVLVKGGPDYYVKTGKLSFNVATVQPVGMGKLHVEFELLKQKLAEEGLFDEAHKKAIPQFPKDVCVITSKTGAVIRDINKTVRLTNRSINLHVYNVKVQGEGASAEICNALRAVDGKYDVIIIARGGGSFEDLAPFNTEEVARAVYAAQTPVISAVGHETDYSLCDFASDARAATPTAAATFIAYDEAGYIRYVFDVMSNMGSTLQNKLTAANGALVTALKYLTLQANGKVSNAEIKHRSVCEKLVASAGKCLALYDVALQGKITALSASNPANILAKGYFGASLDGKRIADVKSVEIGNEITLRGKDGTIKAKVTDKEVAN